MQNNGPLFRQPRKSSFGSNSFFGFLKKFTVILLSFALVLFLLGFVSQVLAQTPQTYIAISGPQVGIVGGSTISFLVNVSNLTDPNGLGGFGFTLSYNKNLISIIDADGNRIADPQAVTTGSFLGSTGKEVNCSDAYIDPDRNNATINKFNYACVTIGDSPNGPSGNGTLANVKFKTGNNLGVVNLNFSSSQLASNIENTYDIPHSASSWVINIVKCADMNGDRVVAITDILAVASKFSWNSSIPGWDPKYDLDGNNVVSIQDILIAAKQFSMICP